MDDIKLIRFAEFDKIGNIACYAHKQVLIFFRLFHGLMKGVAVNYIELNMEVSERFKGSEVVNKAPNIFFGCKYLWSKTLVKQRPISNLSGGSLLMDFCTAEVPLTSRP